MNPERSVTLTPSLQRVYLRPVFCGLLILWGSYLLFRHLVLSPETLDMWQTFTGGMFVIFGVIVTGSHLRLVPGRRYIVTDKTITFSFKDQRETLELLSIKEIELEMPVPERWLNVGDVVLKTSKGHYVILGQKNPASIRSAILAAIDTETERSRLTHAAPESVVPDTAPGSLDRLDTLTGLWQQGLMSEEDFRNEEKRFRS